MRLPRKITILGNSVDIKQRNLDGIHGSCDVDINEIEISKDSTMDKDQVLFHEIIHYILGKSGVSELLSAKVEESVVTALENGLFPLIHLKLRNPKK